MLKCQIFQTSVGVTNLNIWFHHAPRPFTEFLPASLRSAGSVVDYRHPNSIFILAPDNSKEIWTSFYFLHTKIIIFHSQKKRRKVVFFSFACKYLDIISRLGNIKSCSWIIKLQDIAKTQVHFISFLFNWKKIYK